MRLKKSTILGSSVVFSVLLVVFIVAMRVFVATGWNNNADVTNYADSGNNVPVSVGTAASVTIMRFGFIPVYASGLGDLSLYYLTFIVGTALPIFGYAIKKGIIRIPTATVVYAYVGHKIEILSEFHPESASIKSINLKDNNTTVSQTLKMGTLKQSLLYIWAPIGAVWFLFYNFQELLTIDAALLAYDVLGLLMWGAVAVSIVVAVRSYLKRRKNEQVA